MSAAFFARPGLGYFDHSSVGLDGGVGPTLAVGTALGAEQRHELAFEVMRAPWDFEYNSAGMLSSITQTGSGHLMPVLASYRLNLGSAGSRVQPFLGVSVGSTKWSGNVHTTSTGGFVSNGGPDAWATTWGGTVGVAMRVSDTMAVELGYRYFAIKGADYGTTIQTGAAGLPGHFDDLKTNVGSLALSFRF